MAADAAEPVLSLPDAPLILLEADWRPVGSATFQPPTYPGLGVSTFRDPDGAEGVLLESCASVANRLEALCLDPASGRPVAALAGVPYVRVLAEDGEEISTTWVEPHRLAGPVFLQARLPGATDTWRAELTRRCGLRPHGPYDARPLHAELFRLDPLTLIHGVFFPSLPRSPHVARALVGLVEAHGAEPAERGGVKRERLLGDTRAFRGGGTSGARQAVGWVPHTRTAYTARRILSRCLIDLRGLRALGLTTDQVRWLYLAALWKVLRWHAEPLRARSECVLQPGALRVSLPEGGAAPPLCAVEARLRELTPRVFAGCGITTLLGQVPRPPGPPGSGPAGEGGAPPERDG